MYHELMHISFSVHYMSNKFDTQNDKRKRYN